MKAQGKTQLLRHCIGWVGLAANIFIHKMNIFVTEVKGTKYRTILFLQGCCLVGVFLMAEAL